MKKKLLVGSLLVAVFLCVVYFATPIRPAIARAVGNRYIQERYPEYDFPPAESVSVGRQSYYWLEWTTDYSVASREDSYQAVVKLYGWLPFWVEESSLWEIQGEKLVLLQEN